MTTPWKDPIVEETRSRGQQLATEAGDDMHTYFENMRRAQERYAARVVDRIESARATASGS
jgi:hypothetical protein